MKKYVNGKYIDLTPEEISAMQKEAIKATLIEQSRHFTAEEVITMFLRQQVNTLEVDDNTALRMKDFYPDWTTNTSYTIGYKIKYNGRLYKVLQAHTSQDGWEPTNASSLWTEVCEIHAGTMEDPIPYNNNMALENGKYYYQNYEIYLCTRDTVNPVYNNLNDLVGLYVEAI
jgi:hypothetical protein